MQDPEMACLAYVSSAVPPMSDDTIKDLLHRARENNARQHITGVLLYDGGNVFQVIEGPEAEVEALFQRILADTRHTGIIVLLRTRVTERQFPDWLMAFRRLEHPTVAGLPGVSDFLEARGSATILGADATRAQKLLAGFKHIMAHGS
jgi:hypothetical protein